MSIEIITPGRFVESKDPLGLQIEIEGWFTLAAVRNGRVLRSRKFKVERKVGPFHNLLLDVGMDILTRTYLKIA
jgi:hypothetical protein